ncbi:uncharacterized protein TrAFT101_008474 [Trichoderma asperellum]|uniref:uncharacterized protein n=2 Tax=Trichoderma asperellum TaxID=101201 RepID=UPI003319BE26|nr:hypothetical protein TrAFT101_008474 [Trichoderma asperellum]
MATISAKSHNVRQHFLDFITLSRESQSSLSPYVSPSAIVDCLERFSLWAGNMGAMRSPQTPLSLDQRLSQAADIGEQINRQLGEIEEAIDDLTNIIRHPISNRDIAIDQDNNSSIVGISAIEKTSKGSLDEASINLQIIHECINSLFRLGMLIRKLSPRDRFKQALLNSDLTFPDSFDIDYVKNKYPKIANSPLSIRVGGGIAKRRNFIRYCRDHRSRLGMDETTIHNATDTELLSSKATTFAPLPNFNLTLQEEEFDDFSLVSASTMATSLSNLTLPRLVDLAPTNQPFECPICFTIQSFRHEKSWKLHAFRDLKAYVCTQGGVECDAEFFEDRDSWFEHELQKHRSRYSCILCKSAGFSDPDLQDHILKVHGDFSDSQLRMLQEGGRKCPTQFEARDCPFCDEWAEELLQKSNSGSQPFKSIQGILVNHERFKRHVASHQEQLAIFAVPRANEDEDLPISGSITHSVEVPTSIATDINAPQDEDVEGENVFEQNTHDVPDDISSNHSTTSKDDMPNAQRTNAFIGIEHNNEIQEIATVDNSPRASMISPISTSSAGESLKIVPVKSRRNAEFQQQYRATFHTWECVCIISEPLI